MKSLTEQKEIIAAATPGGQFPAADKRFIIAARTEWPELVEWAEKARICVEACLRFGRYNIVSMTMDEIRELEELLKELPE
jgi:hypothetical protein